jgi:hypothetical protein
LDPREKGKGKTGIRCTVRNVRHYIFWVKIILTNGDVCAAGAYFKNIVNKKFIITIN